MTYQLLPAARTDPIEIGDFIALDDPARALSFIAEIEATMTTIAERPSSFPARNMLATGLRSVRHGPHLIFFVAADVVVQIIRVLHGARNLPQAFHPWRRGSWISSSSR